MARPNSRLSGHVAPTEPEVIIQPTESVELADIEAGTDGNVINLVEDINADRQAYSQCRDDASSLTEIATSLEELSLLTLESLNEGTGLHAQTLMAIQYGANQHLARVGDSVYFKSLESTELDEFSKTALSVEGLGEAIGKIWDGLMNVAKRAVEAVGSFFKTMLNFHGAMVDKLTKLKSQLMALDEKATGNIKTSAAKRLYYGENSFRQLLPIVNNFLDTTGKYFDYYKANGVKQASTVVTELSKNDNGIPKTDPAVVVNYIKSEETQREALLNVGYGGVPRITKQHTDHYNMEVRHSKGLPGGYRFVSNQPLLDGSDVAPGNALFVMADAEFELVADKNSNAPAEMPVLSIKDSIAVVDKMLAFSKRYEDIVDLTLGAGEKWWELETRDFSKMEKAFEGIRSLSRADIDRLEKEAGKEAFKAGAEAGAWLIGAQAAGAVGAVTGISGSVLVGLSWGAGAFAVYVLPSMVVAGAFVWILNKMFGTFEDKTFFKSDDPNAPLLALMRGISTARSWAGMYACDTIYAVGDYYRHLAPAMLDYIGDSAKAHLAAQKADVSDAAAEPAVA
jgi:hypothetical protein